jgi:glucosyl-3-phosphoglycerate synthase
MADFFQNGTITTLHNLGSRSLEDIETELLELSKRRNMTLIIPALYSEFETPAMKKIIDELKNINYLYKIVIGLDSATKEQFIKAKNMLKDIKTPVDVIWNDGERVQNLIKQIEAEGFKSLDIQGKGRNVWLTVGYTLTDPSSYAMALHDGDILSYTREIPARLFYPIVHPALDFEFNKGYYARVSDKLHGRVMRLFYTPLIKSIEKVVSKNSYLSYMNSFRYALSGEFAFIRSLARGIRISPTWGLEVSTLSEVFHNTSTNRICQSEIMQDSYEHKHQDLNKGSISSGLSKMTIEIAKAIFREMSQDGTILTQSIFKTILASYRNEAHLAINKYNALAKINGLNYNRHNEIEAIDGFELGLGIAIHQFLDDTMGVPSLPAWINVRSVLPEFSEQFKEAVTLDNQEFN